MLFLETCTLVVSDEAALFFHLMHIYIVISEMPDRELHSQQLPLSERTLYICFLT